MKTRLKQQTNAASSQTNVKPHAPLRSYILTCLVSLITILAFTTSSALAGTQPVWSITSTASPTNFLPNGIGNTTGKMKGEVENRIEVNARNLGDATIYGTGEHPITIGVNLTGVEGATAARVEGFINRRYEAGQGTDGRNLYPPTEGVELSCNESTGPCTYSGSVEQGQVLTLIVTVETKGPTQVPSLPGEAQATATISGGTGAQGEPAVPASVEQQLTVSSAPAPFGVQPSSIVAQFVQADGAPATQAGSHPYDLTVSLAFNNGLTKEDGLSQIDPVQPVKDIAVELPPGVVGNELAVAQCTPSVFDDEKCSGASQIGAVHVANHNNTPPWALFNLEPDNGHTNELGFDTKEAFPVRSRTGVRTGSDYGLTSEALDVPTALGAIFGATTQVWGVPADPSHTWQRVLAGWQADEASPMEKNGGDTLEELAELGGHPSPSSPTPFLTMPSECGKPLKFKIAVDSYEHPGVVNASGLPDLSDPNWKQYTVQQPALTGCEALQSFTPHVTVAPDTTYSDTPAGTTVEVSVPQGEGLTGPETLSTSTLKDTQVTLPQGMVLNPGQANGLAACGPAEDGLTTAAEKAEGKENTGPASCPAASTVGKVEIETPLLPDKLEGNVYVLSQSAGGPGEPPNLQSATPTLQIMIAASADDVNLKLVGEVHLDPLTGQLTTTFNGNPPGYEGTPSLPFTHFRLTFSGGAQAALMTPPSCGVYSTSADFTPWSSPFTPDFLSADAFDINGGPEGSACASPLPFTPTMTAGATTDQAGGFTNFSLLLQRGDGQQRIEGLQFKAPAGLSGLISKIPLCPEPQAALGTCSAESQIGHTVVGAGAGPDPLYIPEPGQPPAPIYLTGPYDGAPFGLSIVVPVIAGPFNLGTVVTRAAINIDPTTAQITVSTGALPQVLDGIPTDLRQIDAVIERPEFMFNPTNCGPQEFSGIAQSAQGATYPLSSHFQVGSCQSLKFSPTVTAGSSAKTSKADGASLSLKVAFPGGSGSGPASGPGNGQSNIAKFKVELPAQLPSRLTTLQKACTAKQFAADPAGCPSASVVGHMRVRTPILPVPLEGPMYFVSNGGEAFPNLVIVLQGYGVRTDLVGDTLIKGGVTSSTFNLIPDVPFSTAEVILPEGAYSALAANGDLCKPTVTKVVRKRVQVSSHGKTETISRRLKEQVAVPLQIPTDLVAQNGLELRQKTPIAVSGCPTAKAKATKAKKASRKGKKK